MNNKIKLLVIVVTGFIVGGLTSQAKAANLAKADTLKKSVKPGKARLVDGVMLSPANDLVQNISISKQHSTFSQAISAAGLTETLKSRGPITVFAPTNDALGKLPAGYLDTLFKSSHNRELVTFVSYYVVPGKLKSRDIARQINANHGLAVLTTLSGAKLKARINANRNIVLIDENGNESVVSQFDIEQTNGIMDVVTDVLTSKKIN